MLHLASSLLQLPVPMTLSDSYLFSYRIPRYKRQLQMMAFSAEEFCLWNKLLPFRGVSCRPCPVLSLIKYNVEVIRLMKYHFWGSLKNDLWLKPSIPKRSDIIIQIEAVKKRSLEDLISCWLFTLFCCSTSIQSGYGKIGNTDIQQWKVKFW